MKEDEKKDLVKQYSRYIENELKQAQAEGELGYIARMLVKATLPHKDPGLVDGWGRRNGNLSLAIQPGIELDKNLVAHKVGIPFGVYPRLIITWLTTEAVRTHNRTLILGNSLSQFMHKLGIDVTGGAKGNIRRLKEQMKRLFASRVTCTYEDKDAGHGGLLNINLADQTEYWWNPKAPDQITMFNSSIELNDKFYREVIKYPVPVDMNKIKVLKRSPMELDIYDWLTYRMKNVKEPTAIPWDVLQLQFGSDYSELKFFKFKFRQHLHAVKLVYPGGNFDDKDDNNFILLPGTPDIEPRKRIFMIR